MQQWQQKAQNLCSVPSEVSQEGKGKGKVYREGFNKSTSTITITDGTYTNEHTSSSVQETT